MGIITALAHANDHFKACADRIAPADTFGRLGNFRRRVSLFPADRYAQFL